jgi:hypothetical protein
VGHGDTVLSTPDRSQLGRKKEKEKRKKAKKDIDGSADDG